MTRKYSLTQSPILPLMIRYTVPLIFTNLLQVLWLLTVFAAKPTLEMIFISFPISWLITATVHFIFGNIEISKQTLNT